jgi:hypothetical protein
MRLRDICKVCLMTQHIECLSINLVYSPACVVVCDWDNGRADEGDVQGRSVVHHCRVAEACAGV